MLFLIPCHAVSWQILGGKTWSPCLSSDIIRAWLSVSYSVRTKINIFGTAGTNEGRNVVVIYA